MTNNESKPLTTIEQRLRSALKRLDLTSQFIIQSIFGVFGCTQHSANDVAQEEKVSPETIEGLQADALRALMGYGPKAKLGIKRQEKVTDTPSLSEDSKILN